MTSPSPHHHPSPRPSTWGEKRSNKWKIWWRQQSAQLLMCDTVQAAKWWDFQRCSCSVSPGGCREFGRKSNITAEHRPSPKSIKRFLPVNPPDLCLHSGLCPYCPSVIHSSNVLGYRGYSHSFCLAQHIFKTIIVFKVLKQQIPCSAVSGKYRQIWLRSHFVYRSTFEIKVINFRSPCFLHISLSSKSKYFCKFVKAVKNHSAVSVEVLLKPVLWKNLFNEENYSGWFLVFFSLMPVAFLLLPGVQVSLSSCLSSFPASLSAVRLCWMFPRLHPVKVVHAALQSTTTFLTSALWILLLLWFICE